MTAANNPENQTPNGLPDLVQITEDNQPMMPDGDGELYPWSMVCGDQPPNMTMLTNPEAIEGLPEFIGPPRRVFVYRPGQPDNRCITGGVQPWSQRELKDAFKWRTSDYQIANLDAPRYIPAGSTRSHCHLFDDDDRNIFQTVIDRGYPHLNTNA